MADETENRASKRARRRAKAAEGASASDADALAGDESEPDPPEGGEDSEGKGESDAAGRGSRSEESEANAIRDRNRRLRAKAAARRRSSREEADEAKATGLDTSEMVDDAFARSTDAAAKWLKRNFKWLQWIVVAGIVGGIGWSIFQWQMRKKQGVASDILLTGVLAERGTIGDGGAKEPAGPGQLYDPTPAFETGAKRSEAAEKAYVEASEREPGSGTSILAKLGLAGARFDRGDFDGAISAFEEVKGSPLAKNDVDVRARAMEGIGMSREGKGDHDGALAAFRELEDVDAPSLQALGMYHQARLLADKDKAKAKELLQKVLEKTKPEKEDLTMPPSYLNQKAKDLLERIDPEGAKKVEPIGLPGIDGDETGANVDEETMKLLKKVIGEATTSGGGAPPPSPAPPGSAP